jgi:hypothetical protein
MRNRDRLKAKARGYAESLGHKLGKFANTSSQESQARCIRCEMYVCINTKPREQPLRGDALSVPCKRNKHE